jgi:hypothetical protein
VLQLGEALAEDVQEALSEMTRCNADSDDCLWPIACDACGTALFCGACTVQVCFTSQLQNSPTN